MKIIFLLPPSEGKNKGGEYNSEDLSFLFRKPRDIAIGATQKDLKCIGERYDEAIKLNNALFSDDISTDLAINRYSGVMYNAIDYSGMGKKGKTFFENKFLILSGLYGLVSPIDKIANYKLPIETKGLYKFWGEKITEKLNELEIDYVVNLLPISYSKMIDFSKLTSKVININFLHEKNGRLQKVSHGVKKIKGEWIKDICEKNIVDYKKFFGDIVKQEDVINVNIIK